MRTAAAIAALVSAVVLAGGCARALAPKRAATGTAGPAAQPEKPKPGAPPQLKVAGREVNLAWEEAGKTKLRATASELVGSAVSGKASLKQVSAELYDKGKLAAKLTAPVIEADQNTRVVTARGGVTITSADPNSAIRVVKAAWVKWYSRENKLVGDDGVTAKGPTMSITAAAFVADTRLRTVRVMANPAEARAVLGKR